VGYSFRRGFRGRGSAAALLQGRRDQAGEDGVGAIGARAELGVELRGDEVGVNGAGQLDDLGQAPVRGQAGKNEAASDRRSRYALLTS
jgi:hypothetical protein